MCELRLGLPPAPFHLPKPGLGLAHTRGCSVGTGRFCGFLGGFLILKATSSWPEPEGEEGFRGSTKYLLSTYCVPDLPAPGPGVIAANCTNPDPRLKELVF